MKERVKQLLFGTHTDFFEIFNSLILIGWGAWLVLPFHTFASTKSFEALSQLLSEEVFGLIPLLIGVYILYTLVTFKIRRRRIGILFGSAFWIFIAIIIGAANINATAVPVYSLIAVFSVISYLRQ